MINSENRSWNLCIYLTQITGHFDTKNKADINKIFLC